MDFLDPKKKRAHHKRLMIGYVLVAIALGISTWLLVVLSSGYYYDRHTGTVIQNGLVFIGSHPGSADIYINGQIQQSHTDTKLLLPTGQYNIQLKRKDYRTWNRSLSLQGGKVERLDYPLLFPTNLQTKDTDLYASLPAFASSSPDHHWLLVQQPGQMLKFDVVDITTDSTALSTITIPVNLITASNDPLQSWLTPEWSTDNRHVLLRHHFGNSDEYIMVDRQNPASSFNVNRLFNNGSLQVVLRDKRFDQLYLFNPTANTLQTGDVKAVTTNTVLTHVVAFKPHDDKTILFISSDAKKPDNVTLKLSSGSNVYSLRELPKSSSYLLDLARYDNRWYMVASSAEEGHTYIYRDPEAALKGNPSNTLLPAIVLTLPNPQFLSFSDSARFIAVQAGSRFAVYDAESDRRFYYDLGMPLPSTPRASWMDGSRLTSTSNGKVIAFDFDGTNQQVLSAADASLPAFFDRDYKWLYSLGPSLTVSGKAALTRTELVVK